MKWKDMTGQERYRVVEMARKGERPIGEICRMFGVSRQALNRAMEKVSQAAMEALEPRKSGRKGKSAETQEIEELMRKTSGLEKTVDHWKMRYEIAQAFIDLTRKTPSDKKKKRLSDVRTPEKTVSEGGEETRLAVEADGADTADNAGESAALDEEA
jgi:transposase-like protein